MTNRVNPLHCVVVGCLVRNLKNQVLLIRHHKRGWEIPQGRVEEGENLIEALHREVREEAGVEIVAGPLAAVWSMVTLPPAIIFTFLGSYKSGNAEACKNSGDSAEACWTTESEALEMITVPVMRERLIALLNFNGSTIYRSYTTKPYQVQMEMDLGCRLDDMADQPRLTIK